jgi:hypothetical protein
MHHTEHSAGMKAKQFLRYIASQLVTRENPEQQAPELSVNDL